MTMINKYSDVEYDVNTDYKKSVETAWDKEYDSITKAALCDEIKRTKPFTEGYGNSNYLRIEGKISWTKNAMRGVVRRVWRTHKHCGISNAGIDAFLEYLKDNGVLTEHRHTVMTRNGYRQYVLYTAA